MEMLCVNALNWICSGSSLVRYGSDHKIWIWANPIIADRLPIMLWKTREIKIAFRVPSPEPEPPPISLAIRSWQSGRFTLNAWTDGDRHDMLRPGPFRNIWPGSIIRVSLKLHSPSLPQQIIKIPPTIRNSWPSSVRMEGPKSSSLLRSLWSGMRTPLSLPRQLQLGFIDLFYSRRIYSFLDFRFSFKKLPLLFAPRIRTGLYFFFWRLSLTIVDFLSNFFSPLCSMNSNGIYFYLRRLNLIILDFLSRCFLSPLLQEFERD